MSSDNKNLKKNASGSYEIEFKEDGVFLTIYPPIGSGNKIDIQEVIIRLTKKRIKDFDKVLIESIIRTSNYSPVKIAEAQEEFKINASAVISITQDKMKASMILIPPDGGAEITFEDIIEVINQNGIVHGYDEEYLKGIVKEPRYSESIKIAEGIFSVNGQNGKVIFNFNLNRDNKPTVLEDGRVDYKELNKIENFRKGETLCTIIDPVLGIPGKTVLGTPIFAVNGKPAVLPMGKNIQFSEDKKSLISTIDGQVVFTDNKINIFPVYEVAKDVDNSTGNISFVGNVIIKGNVLAGFSIRAGGNVEVNGVVEGAVIQADGDIILRKGMQGMGKGILTSGGDIISRYIENSKIHAKNNIKAEAILHSHIKCSNKLELCGKKGLLLGGTVKVGKEIIAKVIGSDMSSTVTEIEVGVDPTLKEK